MDRQTLFHRTLLAKAGVPIKVTFLIKGAVDLSNRIKTIIFMKNIPFYKMRNRSLYHMQYIAGSSYHFLMFSRLFFPD